jgi:hypothetical protein
MFRAAAVTSILAIAAGCSHPSAPTADQMANAPKMYTLTNLHPDLKQKLLYTANFQLPALIPVCSEVKMGEQSSKEIAFVVVGTGVKYLYRLAPAETPEGLTANVAKYFGPHCDSAAVQALQGVNREGVVEGKAMIGMSKQAVIYAIGYPPLSETASTTSDHWTYWSSRHATFNLIFADSLVTKIQ